MWARLSFRNLTKKSSAAELFYCRCFPTVNLNSFRNKSDVAPPERTVITDDGSTIVCWHPPNKFPYECSRPIVEEEMKPTNSVLKVENRSELYHVFKSEDETKTREELMKLTSTTKHRWFPNNTRYKKNYKRIRSDREWL